MEIQEKLLKDAIQGESNAVAKYEVFSRQALDAGYRNIAYLFKSLVFAERIHIKNHKNALNDPDYEVDAMFDKDVVNIETSVQSAIDGETYEYKEMYPSFRDELAKKAQKGIERDVVDLSFRWAAEVEKTHAEILEMSLVALRKGKDLEVQDIYVCRVCGNLVLTKPNEVCPVCKHDKRFYRKIQRPEAEK